MAPLTGGGGRGIVGSFLEVSHLALLLCFLLSPFFQPNVSDPFLIPALSLFYHSFWGTLHPQVNLAQLGETYLQRQQMQMTE